MKKNEKKQPAKKLGKAAMKKTKGGLNFTYDAGQTGPATTDARFSIDGRFAAKYTPGQ